MFHQFDNSSFTKLAHLLVGLEVNSNIVIEALKFICENGHFECGLVAELDYSSQLSLREHYTVSDLPLEKDFTDEKLTLLQQKTLSHEEILFLEKSEDNLSWQKRLLSLHEAISLVLVPVADEEEHICGFLSLFNVKERFNLQEEDKKMITTVLSMLVHYVSGRMYQRRLQQNRVLLENILENTGIDIYVNDLHNHDILYINESMAAPYGGRKMFQEKKCWQVLFPGQSGPCEFCPKNKIVNEKGEPSGVYIWDYQRTFDGSWFRVFSAAFYWNDGRLAHVVSSADITDNKRNEAIIENLANYDQLTKLPNRRMLLNELEHLIQHSSKTEQGYVLFFDIDGFKAINDTYGHDAGDDFLIALGEFFSSVPLLKDRIYRNGGDEFVAVVGGESVTKSNILSLTYFIHQRFKKHWKLRNGEVLCNTSIGVACYPEDGITGDALLQKADMAMYQAKKAGGGDVCFGYQIKQSDTETL